MELLKNKVAQYTLVSDGAYGQEETLETIVPDVNPDVLRIICASSELCMKEKSIQTGKIRANGEIRSRIFYTAEGDSTIWQVEGVTPFTCTVDLPEAGADDTLIASCGVVGAQASMVNPRKLSVKTRYCIYAQIYRQEAAEFIEGVDCKPEDGMNTRVETVQPLALVGLPERRLVINEEIRLSGGALATDRLYRSEVSWAIEEQKVLTNKIMLRGSACVKAVTIAEKDGALSQHVYNLPFAQIIESDNTDVDDEVRVECRMMQKEIRLVAGADGAPVLQCSITASAQAFVSRRTQVRILTDLYSTAYESELETAEIVTRVNDGRQSVTALFSETAQTDYPAVRVQDVSVCCECRRPTPGDTSAAGWLCFQVLYETTTGGLCCLSRKIEVEAQLDSPFPRGACLQLECVEPQVTCTEDGGLCLTGKGVFVCTCPECKTYRQIKSCRLNRQSCKSRPRRGTLILRSYDGKDTIWQIAKKYNTTSGDILAANKITGESELTAGRLIIIPFSR